MKDSNLISNTTIWIVRLAPTGVERACWEAGAG